MRAQKPVALLERIIQASSNPDDVALDSFCGCGTTIDAAEKLDRQWIGIDITQMAIALIKKRLQDTYGSRIQFVCGGGRAGSPPAAERRETSDGAHGVTRPTESIVHVIGAPTTLADPAKLAEEDKFQLQWRGDRSVA